jgi:hypothetical protein
VPACDARGKSCEFWPPFPRCFVYISAPKFLNNPQSLRRCFVYTLTLFCVRFDVDLCTLVNANPFRTSWMQPLPVNPVVSPVDSFPVVDSRKLWKPSDTAHNAAPPPWRAGKRCCPQTHAVLRTQLATQKYTGNKRLRHTPPSCINPIKVHEIFVAIGHRLL